MLFRAYKWQSKGCRPVVLQLEQNRPPHRTLNSKEGTKQVSLTSRLDVASCLIGCHDAVPGVSSLEEGGDW